MSRDPARRRDRNGYCRHHGQRNSGRWRLRPGLGCGGQRREEAEWIVIALAAGVADAEVQVRRLGRSPSADADRAQTLARRHLLPCLDRRGREMQVGGVEAPVGRAHRDGEARRAGHARKADLTRRGRHHASSDRPRDVDAAVLARRVWIVAVAIRRDHLAAQWPTPAGVGWRRQCQQDHEDETGGERRSSHVATVPAARTSAKPTVTHLSTSFTCLSRSLPNWFSHRAGAPPIFATVGDMERTTRMLLGLVVACAAAFLLVTLFAYELDAGRWLDRVGLEGFIAMQTSSVHEFTRAAVRLGDPAQVGLIGVALASVAVARGRPRVAILIVLLLALTSVSSQLLKELLAYPRLQPMVGGGHVGVEALPSGHSTAAMALALAAIFAAPRRARPAAAVVGAALALTVGFSVVSLGWHFPSDVLAGFLLATGWALALAAGLRELDARHPVRPRRASIFELIDSASANGLTVVAAGLALAGLGLGLLFAATHAPEIAEFGRDRTATVAIVGGMALVALALPAGMAAALRRS